MAPY
ncbi:uncharacterized protein FFB20_15940 [Fusarium fujikuroi]